MRRLLQVAAGGLALFLFTSWLLAPVPGQEDKSQPGKYPAVEKFAHKGYVETILGRRRYIPELRSRNFLDQQAGQRIAANTPIQGSAADLCKLAMLRIARELAGRGMRTRMLLQIHDELVFEAPPEEVDPLRSLVIEAMREPLPLAVPLLVPLLVEVGVGANWEEAH